MFDNPLGKESLSEQLPLKKRLLEDLEEEKTLKKTRRTNSSNFSFLSFHTVESHPMLQSSLKCYEEQKMALYMDYSSKNSKGIKLSSNDKNIISSEKLNRNTYPNSSSTWGKQSQNKKRKSSIESEEESKEKKEVKEEEIGKSCKINVTKDDNVIIDYEEYEIESEEEDKDLFDSFPPNNHNTNPNPFNFKLFTSPSTNPLNKSPTDVFKCKVLNMKLITMGFDENMVAALIRNMDVTILTSNEAIDYLIKGPYGWTHKYVNKKGSCEICKEDYWQHIESSCSDRNPHSPERIIQFSNQSFEHEESERIEPIDLRLSRLQRDFRRMVGLSLDSRSENDALLDVDLRSDSSCPICFSSLNEHETFSLSCNHKFCINCIRSYLEVNIKDGKVLEIPCPSPRCPTPFSAEEIEAHTSADILSKYENFLENYRVNMDKNLRWCSAPNCPYFMKGSRAHAHIICKCGFHMCFKCGEAWHSGSCESHIDGEYRRWARGKKLQRCRKCRIVVEKDEGCNHITCTICSYQWCWICGMTYSDSHFDSTFFGCPGLQFTDRDWSFFRIFCVLSLYIVFWPFICLYFSFAYGFAKWEDLYEAWDSCKCFRYICFDFLFTLIILLILSILAYVVLLIPSWGYQFYKLFFLMYRVCRN